MIWCSTLQPCFLPRNNEQILGLRGVDPPIYYAQNIFECSIQHVEPFATVLDTQLSSTAYQCCPILTTW